MPAEGAQATKWILPSERCNEVHLRQILFPQDQSQDLTHALHSNKGRASEVKKNGRLHHARTTGQAD